METFLDKTAAYILSAYKGNEDDVTIVLPGRRAALFLRESIAAQSGRILWSPKIFSVDDFISGVAELQIMDPLESQLEAFAIYSSLKPDGENLESFLKWAPSLLTDFNEVDAYLADPVRLFSNLRDVREIENWSLGAETLTDFQKKYLQFWDLLGEIYFSLREHLLKKKQAYQGLVYRTAAEKVLSGNCTLPSSKIIFAGFNALSTAEERIIDSLYKSGNADVLWDADEYYLNNKHHEAGKFLREYFSKWPLPKNNTFSHISKNFQKRKNINVVAVPGNIAQARFAGQELEKIFPVTYHNEAALVLADEKILFPVLHSFPENTPEVNVTMGFPFKQSPVASLIMGYMNVLLSAKGNEKKVFHHAALTSFFSHALVRQLSPEATEPALKRIVRSNQIYLSLNPFRDIKGIENIIPLFENAFSVNECFARLQDLISLLRKNISLNKDSSGVLTNEFLFHLSLLLKKVKTILLKPGVECELHGLRSIIQQCMGSLKVPFTGEPLRGLQLMGMLETRTLDFKNVILLSANENILPASSNSTSFIPHDLKKAFGLPIFTDKDAVFGYHFYRLLQRAENVTIIYNSQNDLFGSGEKSRFVTQVLHELKNYHPDVKVQESVYSPRVLSPDKRVIDVPKSSEVTERLGELTRKGISPSLLNAYFECGFKFYLRYVASVREADEVEEEIGADTLGTVIHETLEKLYQPHVGFVLTEALIKDMESRLEKQLTTSFTNHYFESGTAKGKNHLIYQVASEMITRFLKKEKASINLGSRVEVLHQEEKITHEFSGEQLDILFSGVADRIEKVDGVERIADYKTGTVEDKEVAFKTWDDLFSGEKSKALQLMTYAWMYYKSSGKVAQPGIYSLRKIKSGIKLLTTPEGNVSSKTLSDFEKEFTSRLPDLFGPSSSFKQRVDEKGCEFCSYKTICGR